MSPISPQAPLACKLDFLKAESYYSNADQYAVGPDRSLEGPPVVHRRELLQEAQYNTIGVAANPDGTNQPFVCVVEQTFELECLDIAGASTLSNLVDQSSIFSTDYTGAEA